MKGVIAGKIAFWATIIPVATGTLLGGYKYVYNQAHNDFISDTTIKSFQQVIIKVDNLSKVVQISDSINRANTKQILDTLQRVQRVNTAVTVAMKEYMKDVKEKDEKWLIIYENIIKAQAEQPRENIKKNSNNNQLTTKDSWTQFN